MSSQYLLLDFLTERKKTLDIVWVEKLIKSLLLGYNLSSNY